MSVESVLLRSGPVSLEVRGVKLEVLEDFFSPFFEVRFKKPDEIVCAVIHVDMIRHDKWLTLHKELCINRKNPIVIYPSKKVEHHVEGHWINPNVILCSSGVIQISNQEKKIELIVSEDINFQPLLRVIIRDVMLRRWYQLGGILLHASAIVTDQGAVLFVGPKGTGKTHLLLHCVRHGMGLLAFDRVVLWSNSWGIQVYSWPTYFNITQMSYELYPDIFHRALCSGELKDGKHALTAKDVKHLPLHAVATYYKMIFPHYSPKKTFSSVPASSDYSLGILQAECMTLIENHLQEDWHAFFPADSKGIKAQADAIFRRLIMKDSGRFWTYDRFPIPLEI